MNKSAHNYKITMWTTSSVIFVLVAILVVIQYFWITAMVDMRKSIMTGSIFLAFNECAYEVIDMYNEISDEEDSYFPIEQEVVPPEDVTIYKEVINNTIKHYMDNNEINVPYYWAVVKRNGSKALIENDHSYLKETKTSAQTYRISSQHHQFPYDLIIQFFNSGWQIPGVVYSTIFVLGFCLMILIIGIIYNTQLYYKKQKETDFWMDFIGNMVHEFKTPMSTISLASEMMMKSNTADNPERITRYSSLIYKENSHLKEMIDKLLRTVSLDMSAMSILFVPIDIHEEIRKITDSFSLRIGEKGGKLTTNLNAENHIISGDKMHIFNVINNLLENAEKYSDDAPQIHVETKNDRNGLYISVKDKGIGIPSKHFGKIFKKFYRVRSDRSYSDSGYGLGLFYVNYVVRAHHGHIRVTSKEKVGSTFELYFPYKCNSM
ncbi:MAG: HAMP domain-containing histidine kinase [Bacteroidales bacterium]|nr:HAMP domain-containing histidine kinase [Bacteroidales bacterium]